MDGIEVDFFFSDHPIDCIKIDGINYRKPLDVFMAKRTIGRLKDWSQLRQIAESIFSRKDFDNAMKKFYK